MSARPLSGVRVLVTRPAAQAAGMIQALREAGAEVVAFPATRIEAPTDGGTALTEAAGRIASFDWVVFSSANGVDRLFAALEEAGTVEAAVVAERHVAEGLVEALGEAVEHGARVLLPQAAGARPALADGLRGLGAEVEVVEAYRSVTDGRGAGEVRERLDRGEIGVVTFTSPSTVERFAEVLGADAGGALIAVIGPVTAEAAASLGLPPRVVAREHTVGGLIEALVEHFNNPSTTKS